MTSKRVLNVAEKPSVARELANILSGGRPSRRGGYGEGGGNTVWEFSYDVPGLGPCHMVMTSVRGHLRELDFDARYRKWKSCKPIELLYAPVEWKLNDGGGSFGGGSHGSSNRSGGNAGCGGDSGAAGLQALLQAESRTADVLVLWTDCDREGEAIGREVADVCTAPGSGNPRLVIKRARFSALTPADIQRAVSNLGVLDHRAADAVHARQEVDLRLGAAFTRLQTGLLGRHFEQLCDLIISYGPCQFPTLGFVVNRYLQIESFQPEEFWSIELAYKPPLSAAARAGPGAGGGAGGGRPNGAVPLELDGLAAAVDGDDDDIDSDDDEDGGEAGGGGGAAAASASAAAAAQARRGGEGAVRYQARNSIGGRQPNNGAGGGAGGGGGGGAAAVANDGEGEGVVAFRWSRVRLFDELAAKNLHEMCVEAGLARVVSCRSAPERRYRPLPLTTQKLLEAMTGPPYRFSSKAVASWAEELYTEGFISYPRTETDGFHESMDVRGLVELHRGHPVWGAYATGLLDRGGFEAPAAGGHDDGAHPPIHPLRSAGRDSFKKREHWAVYEFVARRFLACCSADAVGQRSSVEVVCAGERFTASGTVVLQRNFLDILPWIKFGGGVIPAFSEGQTFVPSAIQLVSGSTAPPHAMTESELVRTMGQHGIGTDATMAEHISRIQERCYVQKDEGTAQFQPTTLGMALLCAYRELGLPLGEPHLRAQMERSLLDICNGHKTKEQVISAAIAAMEPVYKLTLANAGKLLEEMGRHFHPIGSLGAVAPAAKIARPPLAAPAPGAGAVPPVQLAVPQALSKCGVCSQMMQLRIVITGGGGAGGGGGGKERLSLFCTHCNKGYLLDDCVAVAPHPHTCPLCKFQVVTVTKQARDGSAGGQQQQAGGRSGSRGRGGGRRKSGGSGGGGSDAATADTWTQTLCPHCYNHPPPQHYGRGEDDALHAALGQMRCSDCTAAAVCPLARGGAVSKSAPVEQRAAASVMPCGAGGTCNGNMLLRRTAAGRWMLSCDSPTAPAALAAAAPAAARAKWSGCPHAFFLPAAVTSAEVSDGVCPSCSSGAAGLRVRLLRLQLAAGRVPSYMRLDDYYQGCMVCDNELSSIGVDEMPCRVTKEQRAAVAASARAVTARVPAAAAAAAPAAPAASAAPRYTVVLAPPPPPPAAAAPAAVPLAPIFLQPVARAPAEPAAPVVTLAPAAAPARVIVEDTLSPEELMQLEAAFKASEERAAASATAAASSSASSHFVPHNEYSWSGASASASGSGSGSGGYGHDYSGGYNGSSDGPACKECGGPTTKAVSNSAQNKGREYWKCGEHGFSVWATGGPSAPKGGGSAHDTSGVAAASYVNGVAVTAAGDPICPTHNAACVQRAAGPGSAHAGRAFWACPMRGPPGSPACKSFWWADEELRPKVGWGGGGGGGTGSGGGGGALGSAGEGCFKCGQFGHFARDCPNSGSSVGPGAGRGGGAGGGSAGGSGGAGRWAGDEAQHSAPKRRKTGGAGGGGGEGGPPAPRKCSVCGNTGHTKLKCPQNR